MNFSVEWRLKIQNMNFSVCEKSMRLKRFFIIHIPHNINVVASCYLLNISYGGRKEHVLLNCKLLLHTSIHGRFDQKGTRIEGIRYAHTDSHTRDAFADSILSLLITIVNETWPLTAPAFPSPFVNNCFAILHFPQQPKYHQQKTKLKQKPKTETEPRFGDRKGAASRSLREKREKYRDRSSEEEAAHCHLSDNFPYHETTTTTCSSSSYYCYCYCQYSPSHLL